MVKPLRNSFCLVAIFSLVSIRVPRLLVSLSLLVVAPRITEAQWIAQPNRFQTFDASTTLNTIGVTQLRNLNSGLNGSGVNVAQAEVPCCGANTFEVSPTYVGQPQTLFTWIGADSSSNVFPNSVGSESQHADLVGSAFYGRTNSSNPEGVAYGVNHVDNWIAGRFYYFQIAPGAGAIQATVANQSFLLGAGGVDPTVDQNYDNYVARFGTIFVSGVGNSGPPTSPSTCYNGIDVAAFGGASSIGPTGDNGRSKPDITAPATFTSYSTPLVAGAAAILVQGTAAPTNDSRTVKALLLNGATKPLTQPNAVDRWTHTSTAPLDTRYGAGVLNVFNSYKQLQGGRNPFTAATTSTTPPVTSGNVAVRSAWDYNTITSTFTADEVNHYFFDLPTTPTNSFNLTSTLVWNRKDSNGATPPTPINNLDLYLYTASGTLVASSVSTVDNVEHLFVQALPRGRYDLEVFKHRNDTVSADETYALAFNFASVQLTGAVSRKVHGAAGTFDMPLPLTGAPGIECRMGQGTNSDQHQVVLLFAVPVVSFNSAAVTAGTGNVSSTSGSGTSAITVNLSGVSNAQWITITLFGVNDGTNMTDVSVNMGVLLADVDASGRVDSNDVFQVRQQTLQTITVSNFREDIDTSGRIDTNDVFIARQQTLTGLP